MPLRVAKKCIRPMLITALLTMLGCKGRRPPVLFFPQERPLRYFHLFQILLPPSALGWLRIRETEVIARGP